MVIFWALAVSLSKPSFLQSVKRYIYSARKNKYADHQDHPQAFQPRPLHLRLHLNL